ncbi:MAG: energy transducer TonB [Candidatus Zixiibacteriota bacterium]|jgi:protein TonB
MIWPKMPVYMPYGAFELKACYQRNLLLANLMTAAIIGSAVCIFWIAGALDGQVVVVADPGPIVTRSTLGPPPTIIHERPAISTEPPASVASRGHIPKPLPDELVLEDNIVIASRDDLRGQIDRGPGGDGSPGSGVFVEPDTTDVLPPPDSFRILEKYPELIHYVEPEYPRIAKLAGLEGIVWVKALVSKEGRVLDALVEKSSETAALDEAAVKAAYENRFTPGIQNGRPVAVWVTYRVQFVLER